MENLKPDEFESVLKTVRGFIGKAVKTGAIWCIPLLSRAEAIDQESYYSIIPMIVLVVGASHLEESEWIDLQSLDFGHVKDVCHLHKYADLFESNYGVPCFASATKNIETVFMINDFSADESGGASSDSDGSATPENNPQNAMQVASQLSSDSGYEQSQASTPQQASTPPLDASLNAFVALGVLNTFGHEAEAEEETDHVAIPENYFGYTTYLGAGGGGDDPDPAPGECCLDSWKIPKHLDSEDFLRLKKLNSQLRFRIWRIIDQIQHVRNILKYASLHPESANECYVLINDLLWFENLLLEFLRAAAVNVAIATSAFGDVRITVGRTIVSIILGTSSRAIPWFIAKGPMVEWGTMIFVSICYTCGDNFIAHSVDSVYALKWNSLEFINYVIRFFFVSTTELKLLKDVYGGMITGVSTLSRGRPASMVMLLASDTILKPVLSYVVIAAGFEGVPYFAIRCLPNPYGSYSFPLPPDDCPAVPLSPWKWGCTAGSNHTVNETEFSGAEDYENTLLEGSGSGEHAEAGQDIADQEVADQDEPLCTEDDSNTPLKPCL